MRFILFFMSLLFAFSGASQVEWIGGRTFDFGDIEKGVPASATFTYKNISDEPIVLEVVRSTCGCTVSEWSKQPVEPGQTDSIVVVYSAHKAGYFQKKIKVFFAGKRKAKKLTILGDVFEYE